jgi:hypothetical protein
MVDSSMIHLELDSMRMCWMMDGRRGILSRKHLESDGCIVVFAMT